MTTDEARWAAFRLIEAAASFIKDTSDAPWRQPIEGRVSDTTSWTDGELVEEHAMKIYLRAVQSIPGWSTASAVDKTELRELPEVAAAIRAWALDVAEWCIVRAREEEDTMAHQTESCETCGRETKMVCECCGASCCGHCQREGSMCPSCYDKSGER